MRQFLACFVSQLPGHLGQPPGFNKFCLGAVELHRGELQTQSPAEVTENALINAYRQHDDISINQTVHSTA